MITSTRPQAAAPSTEAQRPAPAPALATREPCTVTLLPNVDFARAARMASLEMALTAEEYAETLDGIPVTERVPPLPGETWRDYAARAASAVMVAYIAGWG